MSQNNSKMYCRTCKKIVDITAWGGELRCVWCGTSITPIEVMSIRNKYNICILVPFYNEEKHLRKVADALERIYYPVLFVNDGSTDNSKKMIRDFETIEYYPNQGKGFAVKYGAQKIFEKGYDWVLVFDADEQNTVEDISQFLTALKQYPDAKIIIGNRLYGGKPKAQALFRYIGNTIISYIVSKIAKQKVGDSQCGMRIYHKDIFKIDTTTNRYDYETEILIKAGKKGYKIVNVPIQCIYIKGRNSKMHIPSFILSLIKLYFKLFRY